MSDDDGFFGVDWDGDGKVSHDDDFMSLLVINETTSGKKEKSGSCLIYMLLAPAGVAALGGLIARILV